MQIARKKALIAIAVFLAGTTCWFWLIPSNEPSWKGKSFSSWFEQLTILPEKNDPAVQAIRGMGPPAIPLLARALSQKPSLGARLIEKSPVWVADFVVEHRKRRKAAWEINDTAAAVLVILGPQAQSAIPSVLKCLDDPDKRICENAVKVLGAIGDDDQEVVARLVKLLGDSDCAYQASLSLAQLSLANSNVIPVLSSVPLQGSVQDGFWAAALGDIGSAAKPALPTLIRALDSKDWGTRVEAAKTIGIIGPDAVSAVPALSSNLHSNEEWVRKCAAIALGRIGPAARDAIPALAAAVTNDAPNSIDAARSLWLISHDHLPVVLGAIEHELSLNRGAVQITSSLLNAIDLAGDIGPSATNIANRLELEIGNTDTRLQFNAVYALARIAPEWSTSLLPVLEKLTDPKAYVQRGPAESRPEVKQLMDLKDKQESYHLRLAAIGALWQLDSAKRGKLDSALIELFKDWDEIIKVQDAIPEEKVLLPVLDELLREASHPEIDANLRDAIRRITGENGERW